MRAKPILPDTDVYTVTRSIEDGTIVFLVRHFPSRDAETSCCAARIVRRAEEADGQALSRAAQVIDRHHGGSG